MSYPYYINPAWIEILRAIAADKLARIPGNIINALLKRDLIAVDPDGGLLLTDAGRAQLDAQPDPAPAPDPLPAPLPVLNRTTEAQVRALRALSDNPRAYISGGLLQSLERKRLIRRGIPGERHLTPAGQQLLAAYADVKLPPYQQSTAGPRVRRRSAKSDTSSLVVRAQDAVAVNNGHSNGHVSIPASRPSAVTLLRAVIFDSLEAQLEQRAPDLLPSIRALRATE